MDIQILISNSLALFFLCLFATAGISKFTPANQDYYAQVMQGYGIRLPELAKASLLLIAAVEVLTGVLILIPLLRIVGSVFAACLLLMYLVLMTIQLLKGKADVDCGCNGPGRQTSISPALILRNTVLVLCAVFTGLTVMTMDVTLSGWSEWILATALAGFLWLVYLSGDQLIANQQKLNQLKALMNV